MKKKLFNEAFRKAENQCGNNTKHGLSNHLEKVFTDNLKFSISKITFVRYYEKYIEGDNNNTSNPSSDLLNKISEYLDYKDYEDFVSKNTSKNLQENVETYKNQDEVLKEKKSINLLLKKYKLTVIVSLLLLIGFVVYYSLNRQRWMVWDHNNYIEVKFDTEKFNLSQLKLYSEERIKHFKKIDPDCNTEFFGPNNEVKIWYGKNKKELEYFTALGLHPETGKTLDPITVYMIRKYICEEY
ncbi:hypothetical protein [Jejuia spongiicola]|uniref:Uncharacterized protein n=1 Tax=Jejuia spongiicola TaxID=2942207 RepID=A0ABT0QH13_9FLAO|nr:hypothetical protein [Jejuia spongiicola]MCL6296281.1 hypothetical protein [Jejuia spongiicola]